MSIYTDTRVKALDGIVADLERRISALERQLDDVTERHAEEQKQSKPKAKKWTRENSVL